MVNIYSPSTVSAGIRLYLQSYLERVRQVFHHCLLAAFTDVRVDITGRFDIRMRWIEKYTTHTHPTLFLPLYRRFQALNLLLRERHNPLELVAKLEPDGKLPVFVNIYHFD